MARPRKRHVQQALFHSTGIPTRRNGRATRGGKRTGAGRPPKGRRAGAPHKARPNLRPWQPVHVVLRVVDEVGSLRRRHMYKALREATISVAKRELHDKRDGAFRIVHISLQRNHVHLLCEADHKIALSRGMQSFQISAAKHINAALAITNIRPGCRKTGWFKRAMATRRRGTVFPDRFHQEVITSPRQARRALTYVLNNWRKHHEDRGERERAWNVDPFSTGVLFSGWKEREDAIVYWRWRDTYDPMVVHLPTTWLLRVGWRKWGLVPFREVPGARRSGRATT
jgi:REP element-mobilizing transposase RayT